VPRGDALLRLSTTSEHEPADVDRCLDAFRRVVHA
jgi:7-keto-8-aminopelargonate synthetase-like enzyme